jgi:hypothetical protein
VSFSSSKGEKSMKEISSNDFYEAAFYILNGCKLKEIANNQVNGKVVCNLIVTGENISQLQLTYLNGEAEANILELRRLLGQIKVWVHDSKKKQKFGGEQ